MSKQGSTVKNVLKTEKAKTVYIKTKSFCLSVSKRKEAITNWDKVLNIYIHIYKIDKGLVDYM